jgi:catechol 2,3-dioxygenase-like lactoylglutathione lyase family enzyme
MQIKFASVMVEDQEQALRFYTEILGFAKIRTSPWANTVG